MAKQFNLTFVMARSSKLKNIVEIEREGRDTVEDDFTNELYSSAARHARAKTTNWICSEIRRPKFFSPIYLDGFGFLYSQS